jgi:hypothetical protein
LQAAARAHRIGQNKWESLAFFSLPWLAWVVEEGEGHGPGDSVR